MNATFQNLFRAVLFFAASLQCQAQGVIYDQQSATAPLFYQDQRVDFFDIQSESLTQSFIPTLLAIEFVQLEFIDVPGNGNSGATVYVNVWSGSPNIHLATLLGSSTTVYMPNGFGYGYGFTNFFFPTTIALTAGQTYYLQVVVQSGDDPWDIMVLTNVYANGQLYGNGSWFQPGADLWFREGIVSVPEPTTLALLGITGLLIYSLKCRFKLVSLIYLIIPVMPVYSAPDSVVPITADAAGLIPVSATDLPRTGTFWVLTPGLNGQVNAIPYPVLPSDLLGLPIYAATSGTFIVDDTGGHLLSSSPNSMSRVQATAAVQAQSQYIAELIAQIQTATNDTSQTSQPAGYSPMINYDGLWLETLNTSQAGTNLWLRLHGTASGDYYQLLSATNLLNANWTLGEILNASDVFTDFSPVPMTNATAFYRAHHANPVMAIYNSQDALEPDPTNNDSGNIGIIYIENYGSAASDVTVYYSVSGTATNGIDYASLTGAAMIPANQSAAEIDIQPIADGLKPDQTVILTLLQNTNYLIDPAYYSATNNLIANPEVYPVAHGDNQSPSPDIQWGLDVRAHLSLTET